MKDLRKDIIDALENKSDDEIDTEFSFLIREKLTDKQFWDYIKSWKDWDSVVEEMEEWDIETKKDAIREINEMFKFE